jgi:hypothetical protein
MHKHLSAVFRFKEDDMGTDTEVAPSRELPTIRNKKVYDELPPEIKQHYLETRPGSGIWYYIGV